MAVYKCKMCGGDLEVSENMKICTCEFCGTKQTVPTSRDETIQALYNRANTLRIRAEFDKASELYEKILQKNDAESEAYWGLVLCKYGIEYVEDPVSFKRVPTCHRVSYDAVLADGDYKSAIQYADAAQREIIEEQAREIDKIQKGILDVAHKEKPYDIFICYKETDEDGKRTRDSVYGNDIYYQLTQEGYRVFFSAISLEDKIGQEYEPYIFSALNSAKVMLVLGSKPEYYTSPWVKNEWSRFMKIMKRDRSRLLIPCYRDMDPYDLPEEFSHLQAQDMGKIGFINDLIRGIRKIIPQKSEETNSFESKGSSERTTAKDTNRAQNYNMAKAQPEEKPQQEKEIITADTVRYMQETVTVKRTNYFFVFLTGILAGVGVFIITMNMMNEVADESSYVVAGISLFLALLSCFGIKRKKEMTREEALKPEKKGTGWLFLLVLFLAAMAFFLYQEGVHLGKF